MSTCSQTNKPTINQVVDSCKGFHLSTKCIYTDLALTYLGITSGSSLESILQAITQSLQNTNTRISVLEDTVDTISEKPYKVYTAIVSQSGENAPTAIILENTLGQVPTFSYNTVGNYDINVTGNIFTNNKTFVSITAGATNEDMTLKASALVSNSVSITRHSSGVPADGSITNASIEIRVYN